MEPMVVNTVYTRGIFLRPVPPKMHVFFELFIGTIFDILKDENDFSWSHFPHCQSRVINVNKLSVRRTNVKP